MDAIVSSRGHDGAPTRMDAAARAYLECIVEYPHSIAHIAHAPLGPIAIDRMHRKASSRRAAAPRQRRIVSTTCSVNERVAMADIASSSSRKNPYLALTDLPYTISREDVPSAVSCRSALEHG